MKTGDPADFMMIMLEGSVNVIIEERCVSLKHAPCLLGDSVLHMGERTADVVVSSKSIKTLLLYKDQLEIASENYSLSLKQEFE